MYLIPIDGLLLSAGVSAKVPLGGIYLSLEAFLQLVNIDSDRCKAFIDGAHLSIPCSG